MEIKLARKTNYNGFKLNECQVKTCIDLYSTGSSIIEIASKLGVSQCMITSALKRNNIEVYPRNTRKSASFKSHQDLCDNYEKGMSLTQLGEMYGLIPQRVKKILLERGLYKPPSNHPVEMTTDHLQQAIQLASEGVAYKNIGKTLGYSVWTINKSLYNAGIRRKKADRTLVTYQAEVRRLSNKNYHQFKDLINPNKLVRSRDAYHLDHIFSVYDGFINNVPVEVIAHPTNLQLLESSQNIVKKTRSAHTLEELLHKIKEFDSK